MKQTHSEDEIFRIARAIGLPGERSAYLQQVCGNDSQLFERVVSLLRASEEDDRFLEDPAAGIAPTIDFRPIAEKPGDSIDAYKLLQKIGEGGFGVVYMADQHRPVRRKVALKVIKPGMDTKEVIGRFEAERQALAMMDHPNIAKVLDAGTTESGRPYFVMELVRGIPITEYCDSESLATRERLELFAKVCRAVQHAHQKGVIHRDLKPSNVLITEHDGSPVPKVIDFGVAKAINQQLTEHTVFTQFQQMIGTPMYMSPEQAALSGLDIDTRSDVYSLGVLLYELLTGATPFDKNRFRLAAYDEIRRIIREEEPPKPSTKISTLGDSCASVAKSRKLDAKKLRLFLSGELDWIVMKAMEKDRKRRYETANGFAQDIQRYLNDEPVLACPPSTAYRLQKFASRNRATFATATLIALAMVLGLVGTSSGWVNARHNLARATDAEHEQKQIAEQESKTRKELEFTLYASDMVRAHFALEEGYEVAAAVHSRHVPGPNERDPRGFEWYNLKYRMRPRWSDSVMLPESVVRGMVSPDESVLVLACPWGKMRILDFRSLEQRASFATEEGMFGTHVEFSPDGKLIAYRDTTLDVDYEDPDLNLLNENTDLILRPVHSGSPSSIHHENGIRALAFSSDSRKVAVLGQKEHLIRIWDLSEGLDKPKLSLVLNRKLPLSRRRARYVKRSLAFMHDDRFLAVSYADDLVLLWDLESRQPVHELKSPSTELDVSKDRSMIAIPSQVRQSYTFLTVGADGVKELPLLHIPNPDVIHATAISPDNGTFATGHRDGIIELWDINEGNMVRTLVGHLSHIRGLHFSDEGRRLYSFSEDGVMKSWDLSRPDPDKIALKAGTMMRFTPDGKTLFGISGKGVFRWHASDGVRAIDSIEGFHSLHATLSDHSEAAYMIGEKTIHVADLEGNSKNEELSSQSGSIGRIAISSDGVYVAKHSYGGMIEIWDRQNENRRIETSSDFGDPTFFGSMKFAEDGSYLAIAHQVTGIVSIWESETLRLIRSKKLFELGKVGPIAFCPVSDLVAASGDGVVKIWNWKAAESAPREIKASRLQTLHALHFSRDGKRLYTAGWSRLKGWDVATRLQVASWHFPGYGCRSICESPDGKTLAVEASGGTVFLRAPDLPKNSLR